MICIDYSQRENQTEEMGELSWMCFFSSDQPKYSEFKDVRTRFTPP